MARFVLFRMKHSLGILSLISQWTISISLSRSVEPTKKGSSTWGSNSHLADDQVTTPIVPWEPTIMRYQEADEGPAAVTCAPPAAHCSSMEPGPAADPVRNMSPVPKMLETSHDGIDIVKQVAQDDDNASFLHPPGQLM